MTTRTLRPDPLTFPGHRTLEVPLANLPVGQARGIPSDGMALSNGVAVDWVVPVAGALAFRLRWQSTCAGTLSFAYLRPPPNDDTAYTASNPGNTAILANTESVTDFNPEGEGLVRIRFTPSGNGTLTFADVMQQ